jgi:hypothetical protein
VADPFAEYERIKSESKPIEKEIGGQKFTFPGACPSGVALDFVATVFSTEARIDLEVLAIRSLVEILGEEETQRLTEATSFPELKAIAGGLFRHYGLLQDPAAPNRQARRARGSKKKSSNGSARSEQTSAATTS